MLNSKKYFLSVILYILLGWVSFLNAQENPVIKDLNNSWLVYDAATEAYVPLLNQNQKSHTFSFRLDAEKYKHFLLNLEVQSASELFVNQQFYMELDEGETYLLPIEEIKKSNKTNPLLLSVYSQKLSFKPRNIQVVRQGNAEVGLQPFTYKLSERQSELYKNLLLISLLSILVLIAILKSIDSEKLEVYFNLLRMFSNRKVDDYLYQHAFSGTTLPYLVSSAFIVSVVLLINRYSFVELDFLGFENGFLKLTSVVLINAFMVMFLYFLKYVYLRFIAVFVSVRRFSERHFFEFTRAFTIGFSIILLFSLAINSFQISATWLNVLLFVFFLLWLVRIAFIGRQELGFKNMYLFSYLCTSEIIPFILILKNIGTF